MKNWDVKVHTYNPDHSAILVVQAETKDEAEQAVRDHIKTIWPTDEIRELVVEPSVLDMPNRAQRRAK